MQLRTYTSLWKMERRLYKFQDMTLPYPVSVKQLGILAATALPWAIIMNLLRVPFTPPFGHLVWLTPPVLAAWWGNRPVADGKTLFEYLHTQARYWCTPRTFDGLRPAWRDPTRPARFSARAWQRGKARQPGGRGNTGDVGGG